MTHPALCAPSFIWAKAILFFRSFVRRRGFSVPVLVCVGEVCFLGVLSMRMGIRFLLQIRSVLGVLRPDPGSCSRVVRRRLQALAG